MGAEGINRPAGQGALLGSSLASRDAVPSPALSLHSDPCRRATVRAWLLRQPMGGQAPPTWLRRPITGEPGCREVGFGLRSGEMGARPRAGARVRTLSLGFLLVEPVLPELHGGEHAPPGSVRGAARMRRWRERGARRKTHQQKSKTRERTQGKGHPNPSPSPTGTKLPKLEAKRGGFGQREPHHLLSSPKPSHH